MDPEPCLRQGYGRQVRPDGLRGTHGTTSRPAAAASTPVQRSGQAGDRLQRHPHHARRSYAITTMNSPHTNACVETITTLTSGPGCSEAIIEQFAHAPASPSRSRFSGAGLPRPCGWPLDRPPIQDPGSPASGLQAEAALPTPVKGSLRMMMVIAGARDAPDIYVLNPRP